MFWNKERRKQQQCGISHSLMVSGAAQDGAMYIYCRLDISKHLLDSLGLFYYITIIIRDLVTLLNVWAHIRLRHQLWEDHQDSFFTVSFVTFLLDLTITYFFLNNSLNFQIFPTYFDLLRLLHLHLIFVWKFLKIILSLSDLLYNICYCKGQKSKTSR